jgi:hypothetical protein
MSNDFASAPVTNASMAIKDNAQLLDRRQGLIEALASFSGFALVLATWYGLNMAMKLSALNVTALIAD